MHRLGSKSTSESSSALSVTRPKSESSSGSGDHRLRVLSVKIDDDLRREIDAYATAQGVTRSRAASEFLQIARDAIHDRRGIPNARLTELQETLEGVRALLHLIGPPVIATLRLLAHWSSQSALRVGEDELLAELRFVAAEEWEQITTEAERDLHARALATSEQGS
jgi:hypothetical protein